MVFVFVCVPCQPHVLSYYRKVLGVMKVGVLVGDGCPSLFSCSFQCSLSQVSIRSALLTCLNAFTLDCLSKFTFCFPDKIGSLPHWFSVGDVFQNAFEIQISTLMGWCKFEESTWWCVQPSAHPLLHLLKTQNGRGAVVSNDLNSIHMCILKN